MYRDAVPAELRLVQGERSADIWVRPRGGFGPAGTPYILDLTRTALVDFGGTKVAQGTGDGLIEIVSDPAGAAVVGGGPPPANKEDAR